MFVIIGTNVVIEYYKFYSFYYYLSFQGWFCIVSWPSLTNLINQSMTVDFSKIPSLYLGKCLISLIFAMKLIYLYSLNQAMAIWFVIVYSGRIFSETINIMNYTYKIHLESNLWGKRCFDSFFQQKKVLNPCQLWRQ